MNGDSFDKRRAPVDLAWTHNGDIRPQDGSFAREFLRAQI